MRTVDRRPHCYHCGEADHINCRCPYVHLSPAAFPFMVLDNSLVGGVLHRGLFGRESAQTKTHLPIAVASSIHLTESSFVRQK